MRALAFFALVSIASGSVFYLACSSDETPSSPGTSSSGSSGKTSSGSSGQGSSGSSGTEPAVTVPEGGTLSLDGKCIIYCSPYKKAGKIESVVRDGVTATQVAWTNPEGALEQDTSLATVTLKEGEESQYLRVTNFDFSDLPDTNETWGIQVELTRQSDDGGVEDAIVDVLIDGQQDKQTGKVVKGSWPRIQIGTHHYGQAIDTWETNLNPSDVKKPSFGARIAARRRPGITSAPVIATVDVLKVSVCSCVPGSAK